MLTLFVMKSGNRGKDEKRLIGSFDGLVGLVKEAKSLDWINGEAKFTKWFAVFYDDEYLNEGLSRAIEKFLLLAKADFLVMLKEEIIQGNRFVTKCPRFFRNFITLEPYCLLPKNENLKAQTILDGMVKT